MYNNPFMYRPGLLSRIFGAGGALRNGINWSSILTNTQKSLGIINQAIPLVYQVKPIVNNAKTMFKIAGIVNNKVDNSENNVTANKVEHHTYNKNKPIFYI